QSFPSAHLIKVDQIGLDWADQYRPITRKWDDLVFLQYTSGSTSNPKGVMVSYGNIAANIEMLKRNFGADNDVSCYWLPPYHDMGLIAGIIFPMYLKAKS